MGGAVSRRLSCFTQGKGERAVEYVTVEREAADEFIEKKSRFIGSCRPVQTEEEALDFIAKLKSQYWDASHKKRPAWWTPWWWPPGTLGASCWGAAA